MKWVHWLVAIMGLIAELALAEAQATDFQFHRAQGTQIVNERGEAIFYRGISFGNRVWQNDRIPTLHHGEEEYGRVGDLGMNLVRFYLNYKTFESDEKPYTYLEDGWHWLDTNINWARRHGIYLIFNMHVPQGGFQAYGRGHDLWLDPELQKRLIELWRAIAERYKDEPVVFGYDLLYAPGVPNSKSQWQNLAQQLVNVIRQEDTKHPIIVERTNSVNRIWFNDEEMNYIKVVGDNIIYSFHFFEPFFYTYQSAFWDNKTEGFDGGVWPDPARKHTRGDLAKMLDGYLAWGKSHNVPLFLGQWGLYKTNFEDGRGGLSYVQDMLMLLEERRLTNTFHAFHEDAFGLYRGDGVLNPNNVNKPLLELFKAQYIEQSQP